MQHGSRGRISSVGAWWSPDWNNSTSGDGNWPTRLDHIVRSLMRLITQLFRETAARWPRGCAIVAIRACTCFNFHSKNLSPSRGSFLPVTLFSEASTPRAHVLQRALRHVSLALHAFDVYAAKLTVLFDACRIMEMWICERAWRRSTEIMALTVVPSTRVFNGNGESLLIKVHATIIGDRWPRSRGESAAAQARKCHDLSLFSWNGLLLSNKQEQEWK